MRFLVFTTLLALPGLLIQADPGPALSPFEQIQISGHGDVQILQESHQRRWQVEINEGASDSVHAESVDGVLYLTLTGASVTVRAPQVNEIISTGLTRISAPAISAEQLLLEGALGSLFNIDYLTANDLVVRGWDNSAFRLAGRVAHQLIELSGSTRYRAQHLVSGVSHVSLRDGGDAAIWVEDVLDVEVGAGTTLRYVGTPLVSHTLIGSYAEYAPARQARPTKVIYSPTPNTSH